MKELNYYSIDVTKWIKSSDVNWSSPSATSLKMLQNVNHDYIISDIGYKNYTLETDITTLNNDDDGVGVVVDYIDTNNYKYVMYQGGGLPSGVFSGYSVVLVEVVNGVHNRIDESNHIGYWIKNSTFNLKLENTYGVIRVYVNDVIAIEYDRKSYGENKVGFVTYSQVSDFNNIQIYETLSNKMTAKYVLYAIEESEILTEIEVRQFGNEDVDVEISPRVYVEYEKDTVIDVKYRGTSDILVEIQPYGFVQIDTEIEVPPHNRMWAYYEVEQPPIVEAIFNPTKDSFVRKDGVFSTINYGSSSSMVVGKQYSDEWQSLIGFDDISFDGLVKIIGSKLKVYYSGVIANGVYLGLYEASKTWSEYSVTYLNKPDTLELITDNYTINTVDRYVEFDVSEIFIKWFEGKKDNNGFIIKLEDSSYDSQVIFKTKESPNPPELIVSHYDTRIFSTGRSQITAEISTKQRGNSDVDTLIEVDSTFRFETIGAEIRVHQPLEPLWEDYEAEITSNQPLIPVQITASVYGENEVNAELEVRNSAVSSMDSEIYINKPVVESELFVSYISEIETEITPKAFGYSEPETEIGITRDILHSEIYVNYNDDIESEITVEREEASLIEVEIVSTRPYLDVELGVKYYSYIETELTALGLYHYDVDTEITFSRDSLYTEISSRLGSESDLYASITANKNITPSEIYVKYVSEIEVEIEPNIKSDTLAEIVASKPVIETEITPRAIGESELDAEIFIYYQEHIDSEINVHVFDDMEVEIKAKVISQTEAEITINKPYIGTVITVPYYEDFDVETEIQPRILMVDNIDIEIRVSGKGGAYVFIL